MASANWVGFSGSTNNEFSLLDIVYGIPWAVVLITVFLKANPSNGVSGDNSQREGKIKNSHCLYAETTSSRLGFLIINILSLSLKSEIIFPFHFQNQNQHPSEQV